MYSTKLENVQDLVKSGLWVFPVHSMEDGQCTCGNPECKDAAKHPLTQQGCKDATQDTQKLVQYFSGDYAIANIGVSTGSKAGYWVMDVDDIASLSTLEATHGPLPKTITARTGSGGVHYYFRCPPGVTIKNSQSKVAPKIDVRGEGGYVIAPPSVHRSGNRYEWIVSPTEATMADAPAWLLALVIQETATPKQVQTIQRAKTVQERACLYLERTPPAVSGEGGHNHTFAVFCRLLECFPELRHASDEELIELVDSWNEHCDPPWTDKELRHKLTSARARVGTQGEVVSPVENDVSFPALHEDAYCGLAGNIVKAIEPETEADPAGVLLTLLTAFGNAVGNVPCFHVGTGTHGGNLFTCLVGDTASGKGQSWEIVRSLMRQADPEWLSTCIAQGLSSGEGLVERIKDDTEDVFAIVPTKRLLCLETEFARPITAMRRDGNTLSPILRSAWDGQTLEVMTRGKSKLRASNSHVSVIAHITPSELQKLVGGTVEATNGFANRFLWCKVRSTKSLPHGGNSAVLTAFCTRVQNALTHARALRALNRSPDAARLWESVYDSLKTSTCQATERGRPQVMRLAMIYALFDGAPIIEQRHLKAALAVWRYCEESAYQLFAETNAKTLAESLKEKVYAKPGMLRSELRHAISHKTLTAEFDAALTYLANRGDVVCVPVYGKRQADAYYPGVSGGYGDVGDTGSEIVAATPASSTSPVPTQSEIRPVEPPSPTSPPSTAVKPVPPQKPSIPVSPSSMKAATLVELLDWRNTNGVDFVRRVDGMVWVTTEQGLTPALRAAICEHQTTLSLMATPTPTNSAPVVTNVTEDEEGQVLTDEEFFAAMRAACEESASSTVDAARNSDLTKFVRSQNPAAVPVNGSKT